MRGPRLAPSQLCPGHTAPAPQHWDTGAIFIFLTFCFTLSSASDHRIRTKSLRVQWCSSAVTLFSVAGHYFPLHQRCRAERGTAASACSMLQLHAIAIWRPGQQRIAALKREEIKYMYNISPSLQLSIPNIVKHGWHVCSVLHIAGRAVLAVVFNLRTREAAINNDNNTSDCENAATGNTAQPSWNIFIGWTLGRDHNTAASLVTSLHYSNTILDEGVDIFTADEVKWTHDVNSVWIMVISIIGSTVPRGSVCVQGGGILVWLLVINSGLSWWMAPALPQLTATILLCSGPAASLWQWTCKLLWE